MEPKERFITAFTSARHLSISWASSIQSIPPYPISWKSIFIFSSHLFLGLPSGLFPSGFPTKTLYTPLPFPPIMLHAHPISFSILLGEEYGSLSSSLCIFLHSPVTSFFLSPNILHNTLFLNTLSLHSSLIVSDQISHPYKEQAKLFNK